MIEPNWDYFIHAPLDSGTIRFETKTERALHARVVAAEANWMECKSAERLSTWWLARRDMEAFLDGRQSAKKDVAGNYRIFFDLSGLQYSVLSK